MGGEPLITVSTDFGSVYTAQVLAVLHRRAARARIVLLADDLPAHQIAESAFLFRQMVRGFPAGSIHLAVVDPGVGGRRTAVAIQLDDRSVLVGPNNGLLTPLAEELGMAAIHRIDPERVHAPSRVSSTFHGRDLFAPAAAAIANGARVTELGPKGSLETSPLAFPRRIGPRLRGEVVHVDHFGGLVTSVPSQWVPPSVEEVRVRVGAAQEGLLLPVRETYELLNERELGVLRSSFSTLELSVRQGRAVDRLGVGVGTRVAFDLGSKRRRPRIGK